MSSVRVSFPTAQLIEAITAVASAVEQERHKTLEIMGEQLLSFAQQDYVTKARGGTGVDGTVWKRLTVATLLHRLRNGKTSYIKTKPVAGTKLPKGLPIGSRQKTVMVVAKTNKAHAPLFKQLAKAGVKFRNAKTGLLIKGNGTRHAAGTFIGVSKATASKTVTFAAGAYEIGRDTGLQLNSAGPGYVGTDGKGGNVTKYSETSVTVGFGRSYSGHFDRQRKLMPEQIPDQWMDELEELAAKHNAQVVLDTLSQFGVS